MHLGREPHPGPRAGQPAPPDYAVAVLAGEWADPNPGQSTGSNHVGPQLEFASVTHDYFDEQLEVTSERADHPTEPASAARNALSTRRMRQQDSGSITVETLQQLHAWAEALPLQAEPEALVIDQTPYAGVSVAGGGLRAVTAYSAADEVTVTVVGPAELTHGLDLTWRRP